MLTSSDYAFSKRIYEDTGEIDLRNASLRRHYCFRRKNKILTTKIAHLQQLAQFHPNQLLLHVFPHFFFWSKLLATLFVSNYCTVHL